MKKILLLTIVVSLLVPVGAFAAGRGETAEDGELVIGMSVPSLEFPFFVTMRDQAEAAAAELGATIAFADGQNDAAKQTADIESFISRGVDAILISPITVDSQVPVMERAMEAGIPVASVDRKANTDNILVHVGADNVAGGRAAARYIIEQLGGSGRVIELEGTPGSSAAIDRSTGFNEVMDESDVEIIASQPAGFNRAEGQTVMENLIQSNPDFDAVFGANDEMIIGAIEAMRGSGIAVEDIVTVGFDATPDAFSYIEDGLLDATVDQFPGDQAGQALQYLVDYINNGTEPENDVVFINPEPVTSQ
ncbi:MAG TPA: substrate-binding domain-containing protein [Alkalispirochaeta sp.]|nr:substrate-binding domain-containing protein [Alkalispirochaeta sp.]